MLAANGSEDERKEKCCFSSVFVSVVFSKRKEKENMNFMRLKSKKKGNFTCLVLVFAMVAGLLGGAFAFPETSSAAIFSDVSYNHWAYQNIRNMSNQGIVAGFPDGTFRPNEKVTYGQFIKMAVISMTGKDVGSASTSEGYTHWASKYYKAAVNAGFFSDTQIPESYLNSNIPRCDMALIASNAIKAGKVENYDKLASALSDVNGTTEYAYEIIQAYSNGIITGYTDGTFLPYGNLTRAESAAVITRLTNEDERKIPEGAVANTPVKEEKKEEPVKTEDAVYDVVKLSDYVTNAKEYPYLMITETDKVAGFTRGDWTDIEMYWSENAKLYPKGYLDVKVGDKTWEDTVKLHEQYPKYYQRPFITAYFKNESSMAVYTVQGNKIVDQCRSNSMGTAGMNVKIYTKPTDFDYIICVDSFPGREEVHVYPNPFK